MKKIKVFIVEDSILMQKIISDILSSDPEIEVIGKSILGEKALELIPQLKPDVVTLDVNLPDINGLEVLKRLMKLFPTRVVMLSVYTQKGADITIKALELGALEFIPKPSGEVSLDLHKFKEEIITKIKFVATIDIERSKEIIKEITPAKEALEIKNLVIIGASTGGPKAILEIMKEIPFDIDASFLIVQHMPSGFTRSFAERISWHSQIRSKEAEDGDLLTNRTAYVAPSGYHMLIEKICEEDEKYCIRLDQTPLVNYVRPAIDITMSSAAENFNGKIIGVILTGMGKDGLEGAKKIKERGGKIIAQDEKTSIIYGMPKMVAEAGLADKILPLKEIPKKIIEEIQNE